MSGFWVGLVILLVILVVVLFAMAGVYSWMHGGRASLWEDSGEAVRSVRDEIRKPESTLEQTGNGYTRTEVSRSSCTRGTLCGSVQSKSTERNEGVIDYDDWEARQGLWDKYYKPDTDDWGRPKSESPMRGYTVCQRCSNLVEETWKHLDWHTKLEGEDWER